MSPLVPALAASLLFGYLGYREADRHRAATGRPPWGLPPVGWSVLLGGSLLLGGLLLIVARRTTRTTPSLEPGTPLEAVPVATGPALGETILPRW